jgi:hypothetical protein
MALPLQSILLEVYLKKGHNQEKTSKENKIFRGELMVKEAR